MKVLVTGAAGFIGSNTTLQLLQEQDITGVIALTSDRYTGHRDHLLGAPNREKLTMIYNHGDSADIRNQRAMSQVIHDVQPDVLINFAAYCSVDESLRDPMLVYQNNVGGAVNLASAILQHSPNTLLFQISTDEVLGASLNGVAFPETAEYAPTNPYAESKMYTEIELLKLVEQGLRLVITRCTNNFGPRKYGALPDILFRNMLNSEKTTIHGTGEAVRDWLWVQDNVNAIYQVIQHTFNRGENKEIYHVASQNHRSVNEFAVDAARAINPWNWLIPSNYILKNHTRHGEDRPEQDAFYALSTKKIKQIGWEASPIWKFHLQLRQTAEYYRKFDHRYN